MNNSKATFKAILIALFLLLSQAAVVAHAIDHDISEHSEWCQLLNKVDVAFAITDTPQLFQDIDTGEIYGLIYAEADVSRASAHYSSRAPPKA